jgi:putative aminopeptidase FrvX
LDETTELLKTVTEAHGIPGYETEVRAVLRELMEPLGEVSQDKLGSLICRQPGEGPKVMLAGHMDEIGFMAHHITDEGFIKFVQLGGWWDQVLLGQRVILKTRLGDVLGVIGAKPPHLLDAEERDKVVKKKDMFIDIGASSRDEVEAAGVRLGDPIVPDSQFAVLANGKTYLAKAFDDRIGCALVVDVLRHFAAGNNHPNDLYGVATVMEEVGLRGATTSARAVDPDVAIILESDIAGDVPGIKDEESHIKMGGGPTMLIYDARMIPNLALRDLVIDIAGELASRCSSPRSRAAPPTARPFTCTAPACPPWSSPSPRGTSTATAPLSIATIMTVRCGCSTPWWRGWIGTLWRASPVKEKGRRAQSPVRALDLSFLFRRLVHGDPCPRF